VGAEEPIKVNDDILDALRYVIMFRTIPGNEDSEPELNLPGPQIAFRDRIKQPSFPPDRHASCRDRTLPLGEPCPRATRSCART
jgi:hypothetical protein